MLWGATAKVHGRLTVIHQVIIDNGLGPTIIKVPVIYLKQRARAMACLVKMKGDPRFSRAKFFFFKERGDLFFLLMEETRMPKFLWKVTFYTEKQFLNKEK